MAKRVSTYLKELQKIEKNGDEDLTTKYDHLYHIMNQSKDAEAIKEAYAIIENIKKATIKKETDSMKTPKNMFLYPCDNVFENYGLDFPEETEDESEDPKLYFVIKNTYNEITEYYTSIIKYCNEYVSGKNDVVSKGIAWAMRNHPILSYRTKGFAFSPLLFDKNAPIVPSHFMYEENPDKDLWDKYLEVYDLYKDLEREIYDYTRHWEVVVNDQFYQDFKVFFGDFGEIDDKKWLIDKVMEYGGKWMEEYADDCDIIVYMHKKNLPALKEKYTKKDLLFMSYEEALDLYPSY